jgi:hypothetical protein
LSYPDKSFEHSSQEDRVLRQTKLEYKTPTGQSPDTGPAALIVSEKRDSGQTIVPGTTIYLEGNIAVKEVVVLPHI